MAHQRHGTPVIAVRNNVRQPVIVFAVGSAATWSAGVFLSRTTDALDARLGLGEELGGIVLLAIAGSLPELAITVSACASGNFDLAAGNLIGGIATQTMVLVLCDFMSGRSRPLTFLVGALTPVLEAMLVVFLVSVVLMGALLPRTTAIGGVLSPLSLAIVIGVAGRRVRDRPRAQGTALERLDAREQTRTPPPPPGAR